MKTLNITYDVRFLNDECREEVGETCMNIELSDTKAMAVEFEEPALIEKLESIIRVNEMLKDRMYVEGSIKTLEVVDNIKSSDFTEDELITLYGMALAEKHSSYEMAHEARDREDQKQEKMYMDDAKKYDDLADKIYRIKNPELWV